MAEVRINIGAFNRYVNRFVQPYLMSKAREIAAEAKNNAPVSSGGLSQSISVRKSSNNGAIVEVGAPYAGYVHEGTGPGHRPNARRPYYPKLRRSGLIAWSENKRLNAYQVAHGISLHGTPANPFLEESIVKILGRYNFRWIRKDITS